METNINHKKEITFQNQDTWDIEENKKDTNDRVKYLSQCVLIEEEEDELFFLLNENWEKVLWIRVEYYNNEATVSIYLTNHREARRWYWTLGAELVIQKLLKDNNIKKIKATTNKNKRSEKMALKVWFQLIEEWDYWYKYFEIENPNYIAN